MKKLFFIFILFIYFISLKLFADDNITKSRSSLNETNGVEKAIILYKFALQSDSLETKEKIDCCSQAKKIALDIGDNELLLNILLLESNLYKESIDIEKYYSTIEEYIELYKTITKLKIEKDRDQISKQILIRNSFMVGFLIFFNIAFVVFARYRLKISEHIKLEKVNKQLEEISRKDPLISISNRRDIIDKINYETIRFERNQKTFSLVMGDIDHFKSVNDRYGHDCGDYILKALADTIVSTIRKQDIVGRWGGEEFILLLPETNIEGGKITAEKVRIRIEQNNFKYNNKIIPVTITFGVSEHSYNKDIDVCIKEADIALYKGKNNGRNRVEVFNPNEILIG